MNIYRFSLSTLLTAALLWLFLAAPAVLAEPMGSTSGAPGFLELDRVIVGEKIRTTPQASASATTSNGQSTAAENVVFDGIGTAKDLYYNLLVDDAEHNVGGTATALIANGEIRAFWYNLGDY